MKKTIAVSAISICLTVLVIAGFPRTGDADPIYACQERITGLVRIVSSLSQCKTPYEIRITWQSEGPIGPIGPAGTAGAAGSE